MNVILLLIDSLHEHALQEALSENALPALAFLRKHAHYADTATTVYPTMTMTVDSSLLTGTYPDAHKIPGLLWYDAHSKRIVNYLNSALSVAASGIQRSLLHHLCSLNDHHLSTEVETIHEALHARGFHSASINMIVRRGPHQHRLHLPFLLRLLTGTLFRKPDVLVSGPQQLIYGHLTARSWQRTLPAHLRRPWRAYGVNDGYTVKAFAKLLASEPQAHFTCLYLPDFDHAMHRKNPAHARDAMLQLDRNIGQLLSAFGDWQRALTESVWVVLGDHGQVQVAKQTVGQIDLDELLQSFRIVPLYAQATEHHELAIANNERMAYVYPLRPNVCSRLLDKLCSEARFDVVAWKEAAEFVVCQGGSQAKLRVARWDNEQASTRISSSYDKRKYYADAYGAKWHLTGDLSVLDLQIVEGTVHYGAYPDALARLQGALYAHDEPVIVINARPRYEIHTRTFPRHKNGGAHGSLHRIESEVPLWIATAAPSFQLPPLPGHMRLVDLKALILRMIDDRR